MLVAHQIARGHEVGQYLRPVQALPHERVVGGLVILRPAQLGGHEVLDTRLFKYLRQGRRVSEYVGQPQYFVLLAKLLAEELLTVQ